MKVSHAMKENQDFLFLLIINFLQEKNVIQWNQNNNYINKNKEENH